MSSVYHSMQDAASLAPMSELPKISVADAAASLLPRLRSFVRRRIDNLADADDVVQDALFELVAAVSLAEPLENVTAWVMRVARNRIVDRYRARTRETGVLQPPAVGDDEPERLLQEVLTDAPAPRADDPEVAYERAFLLQELAAALAELPAEQREVFIAHEVDGRSFRELAASSGQSINTLLGRKHLAVLHLRRRLAQLREEFAI